MLLMQNIFASEILILYANYFNDTKSFNLSKSKVRKVGVMDIFFLLLGQQCLCCHQGWIYGSFLALVSFDGVHRLLPLRLNLHQPSIFFHVVGGIGRHDAWLDKSDQK